jgi:hypothetical protein
MDSQTREAAGETLESLVQGLLQEAGFPTSPKNDSSPTAFACMEQWLEISNSAVTGSSTLEDAYDAVTVEDCAPLSRSLYEKAAAMCIHAWNPSNNNSPAVQSPNGSATGSLFALHNKTKIFLQELQRLQQDCGIHKEEELVEALSLDCIPSVLITKWIRHWMECNVDDPAKISTMDQMNKNPRTFSQFLLLGDGTTVSANGESSKTDKLPEYAEALMQALFHHMTHLPYYQSQLLLFNQAFQRGDFAAQNAPTAAK